MKLLPNLSKKMQKHAAWNTFLKISGVFLMSSVLLACADSGKSREMMQAAMAAQPEDKKILEFFMYTCPHCRAVEPTIASWQAKQSVLFQQGIYAFEQIPAVFSASWQSDSKIGEKEAAIFYTLRRMGFEHQMRLRVFAAIQDKSLDASDADSIARFLQKEGIPAAEFGTTFKSTEVKADVNRAESLTRQYGIYSVPAFILFNRAIILPQEYADNQAVEAALLGKVKEFYTKNAGKPAAF